MIGLGIDTSCDETSVAVVEDGCKILSNQVYSQIEKHRPFRGVVPEIAGRAHLDRIQFEFEAAIKEANIKCNEIDYIAVTNRPGLIGSLMIGGMFAKAFNIVWNKPIITVDHLMAHLYSIKLENKKMEYPFLGLLLSGGNSCVYLVSSNKKMELIADTSDDALGEAFDKVAAILNLPYPGGPYVEKLALQHSASGASLFPNLLHGMNESNIRFSYSGLKTAVIRAREQNENEARIAYDFQKSAFELVFRVIHLAIKKTKIRKVICGGGVLASKTLQDLLKKDAVDRGYSIVMPDSKILCTDNAAMVAAAGYDFFLDGNRESLDFSVYP